jgi:hypothetical protein
VGRVFGDLYAFLTLFLPWKLVVGLLAVLVVAALPSWVENMRERQLRGSVRRLVRAEQTERVRLLEDTFGLAGERPSRLVRLVEAGRQYDQRDVVDRALTHLDRLDAAAAHRLRTAAAPPKPKVRDALEAVVRVEGLLREGMAVRAAEVLEESLREHPADPELLALRERLAAERST